MRKWIVLLLLPILPGCIQVNEELPGGIDYTENNQFIAFEPAAEAQTGFIYYPGALVPPESYNAWMETLSRNGFLAVTARMPLNLAVLDVTAAVRIRNKFPEIDRWIVGGHSLGGAMAVQLIRSNLNGDLFDGLVLTGSYPSTDISEWDGQVLSLYGTNDGVSTPEEILDGLPLLPELEEVTTAGEVDAPGSYLYAIEGGNHAQFGDYGPQDGDGTATISMEQQQAEVASFITAFFAANGW